MLTNRDETTAAFRPQWQTAGLLIVLAMVGLSCYLVMRQLSISCDGVSVAMATTAVAVALVPPLWLEFLTGPMVAAPLATVAWRLGVLLPTVVLSNRLDEPARNCVLVTLLACYLMTLPLESWLLIRQATQDHRPRRSRASQSSDRDENIVR